MVLGNIQIPIESVECVNRISMKKSNADTLLQVGEIAFQPAERLFVLEGDSNHLKEITEESSNPDAIVVRMSQEQGP